MKVAKLVSTGESVRTPFCFSEEARNEASILRQLYHPLVVQIQEVLEEPKRFVIIEELCCGGSLADVL